MKGLLAGARFVHQIGLAIWIGGMLMIGAVVAPVAFHDSGLDKIHAGALIGASLLRFNVICYLSGGAILLAEFLERRLETEAIGRWKRLSGIRFACVAGMMALAFYLGLSLLPAMDREKAAGAMARFDAGHHAYEALSQVQFWLSLAAALLTSMMSALPAREARPPLAETERREARR